MKIQVKVGNGWRSADATIDASGSAIITLPHPLGTRTFKRGHWRKDHAAFPQPYRPRKIAKAKVKA